MNQQLDAESGHFFQWNRKALVAALGIAVPAILLAHLTGLALHPRLTGGSFPGENSCTQCHDGVVNAGPGSITTTINGKPFSGYQYKPGEQATVTVTIAEPGKKIFGFQFTARKDDGCVQAGILQAVDQAVAIQSDTITPEGCSGSSVQFANHKNAVEADGTATFTFRWIAPPEDIGRIRFAAGGLAGDKDDSEKGDNTYVWEGAIEFGGGAAVAPKINTGGVVLATGTPVVRQLSPNAIATVYGTDFAPVGTDVRDPIVNEGVLGDKLVDTCVEVNGKSAPIFAVFATQINFQVPGDAGLGSGTVTVIRGCQTDVEQRSNSEPVSLVDTRPAFFNYVNKPDGRNPIAALRQNNAPLAEEGLFGGNPPPSPATQGEYVSLFGTGFGPTDPPLEAGVVPTKAVPNGIAKVKNHDSVRIRVGGIDVPDDPFTYVGVSPCCAGLFQATFKIPENVPDGNHQVEIEINGVKTPAGPYIAVKKQ